MSHACPEVVAEAEGKTKFCESYKAGSYSPRFFDKFHISCKVLTAKQVDKRASIHAAKRNRNMYMVFFFDR